MLGGAHSTFRFKGEGSANAHFQLLHALANGNDVPYNVTMTPFAGLPAGSSGSKDLGHEIDMVITQALTPRSSILFGYSHFFAGNYYATTPGVPFNGDADFFYTQWHVNF